MRIAVLDDDASQAGLVCQALTAAGHSCHSFPHGADLLNSPDDDRFDLLIIHWQIADRSGMDALQWARGKAALPVLVVTGRSSEDDIAAALDAGASDYLIKPVRRGELLTRVRTALRRAHPERSNVEQIRFGEYCFDIGASRLRIGDRQIGLTQKEFELALLFFRNLDRPLSRAYILEAIWSRDADVPSRTMDTHVSRVRNKLGLREENGFRLAPVYSYGYLLEQLAK